jgi:hypothetical protein
LAGVDEAIGREIDGDDGAEFSGVKKVLSTSFGVRW